MLLKTPYEVFHGQTKTFIVTPFSIFRSERLEEELISQFPQTSDQPIEQLLFKGTAANLVIIDAPKEYEALLEEFASLYTPTMKWPKPSSDTQIIDILLFAGGTPYPLPGRSPHRPAIAYSFDGSRRYRSSICWLNSGRPCPICSRNLSHSTPHQAEIFIERTFSRAPHGTPAQADLSLDKSQLLELLSAISDAHRIGIAFTQRDPHAINAMRYSETLELRNGAVRSDIFPPDPSCTHREFYGQ
ncbi:hypothetical protein [Corynebacterium sp.]|uniref:hypothetical protein n=1 Tax=Corynebacterium sp. TaxID=1720 RepID=UPI0026DD80DD|nr:hypothetical protein [Corynebacterium sp.]MDO5032917.1 hypothetical protein [Corynebacterium sp.]